MENNGGMNSFRGSQRALKMLNAHLQKSGNQPAAPKPAMRLAWPSRPAVASLDPPEERVALSNQVQIVHSSSSGTNLARNTVSTPVPVHRQQSNDNGTYASPEASFPSNGDSMLSRDQDISRASFGDSRGLTLHDFNNSNTGFSAPNARADDGARTSSTSVSRVNERTSSTTARSQGDVALSNDEDETRSSMCFSLCDGKVTSIVATTDGAYCIAGFSSGAVRLFDMTKEGNTDPEDRFGYQLGMIESSRGSVHVRIYHSLGACIMYVYRNLLLDFRSTWSLALR